MGQHSSERQLAQDLRATVLRGSDYPTLYQKGTAVILLIDPANGKVAVTRAGAVKLGYVAGSDAIRLLPMLSQGSRIVGSILGICIGPAGKMLHIELD